MRLAARGQRDMGRGVESIDSAADRDRVRKQAAAVHATAILTAVAITAVLYFI